VSDARHGSDEVDDRLDDDEVAEVLASHDPEGLDLATQIARMTAASGSPLGGAVLPPPRGVREGRPRRRRGEGPQRSGSGPDERDPLLVGDALGRLVRDRGWSTQVSVRTLLGRWADLVGADNANHTSPEAFDKGVLTIRADSTTWATSMRMIQSHLIAQLNEQLGEGTVTSVKVLGPSAPSWKHGPRSVRDGRGPRDTYG